MNESFHTCAGDVYSAELTATHCNTLQHTATHCNTLQHTATHCNTHVQAMFTQQNSLPNTATHCNTLQHTATNCNTLQHKCAGNVYSARAGSKSRLLLLYRLRSRIPCKCDLQRHLGVRDKRLRHRIGRCVCCRACCNVYCSTLPMSYALGVRDKRIRHRIGRCACIAECVAEYAAMCITAPC